MDIIFYLFGVYVVYIVYVYMYKRIQKTNPN